MSSKELRKELQTIIEEDYGIKLTDDQVFIVSAQLTDLFETLIYGKEEQTNGETSE